MPLSVVVSSPCAVAYDSRRVAYEESSKRKILRILAREHAIANTIAAHENNDERTAPQIHQ